MSRSSTPTSVPPSHRILNVALWVTQAFVAASFVGAAGMKLGMPIAQLSGIWPWTGELSPAVVRLLGAIDLAGGLGVLLPSMTRIRPRLAVLAAACCIVLQVCAMAFHGSRGEWNATPVNVVFIACCAFMAWGRGTRVPIAAR